MNTIVSSESPPSLRVLVIDDDQDDFELISELLAEAPHGRRCEVDWISDCAQAVAALGANAHDLCLLDYVLGAQSGLELLNDVMTGGTRVPIIFMTGHGDAGIEQRALNAGAADYLIKTEMSPEMLGRAVRHALERDRSAAELRERERQFRALFESALDPMVILDDEGRYRDVNQAAVELFGLPRAELLTKRVGDLIQREQQEPAREAWASLLRHGRLAKQFFTLRADGQQRFVDLRATASFTPGRHLVVIRDLTESKRVEAQLAMSERMASLGTLAAGVAHEINNPLSAVIANLDFIARGLEAAVKRPGAGEAEPTSPWNQEAAEALRDARSSADRIRLIVRDLKLFSKPDEERKGAVDLRAVLESTLRMAWNEIRHRAQLVTDYAEVPAVHGNDARLGQVFLNLIMNAAQAIPEGHAGSNEIRIVTRASGDSQVVVEIRDTGAGIPPEMQQRLFEPFFTTKPVGVGTGLGLPICRRIVSEHGGSIEVESAVGRGATFRVLLPAWREEHAPSSASLPNIVSVRPERRGRVLVIDDEPAIGRVIRRALNAHHDVITVSSGSEALDLLRGGERYDVIMCDMMMPHMTGEEFYEAVCRDVREHAGRIIFLTGGAFTATARAFLDRVPNQRLDKPFDAVHLRGIVTDRIGAAHAEAAAP